MLMKRSRLLNTQEKGTFEVKGAIVLVAEKLAVSEPTVYRYLKRWKNRRVK
ncbi:MAG: helix-turn-helix domain-containing protein [Streptococcus sp.]